MLPIPSLNLSSDSRDIRANAALRNLVVDAGTVQALVTAGFQAIQRNDVGQAQKIFEFLALVRPDKDFAVVGLALTALTDGRYTDAEELLGSARNKFADSEELMGFHALALMFCGRHTEAQAIQKELGSSAAQANMVRFARTLGSELDSRNPRHGDRGRRTRQFDNT